MRELGANHIKYTALMNNYAEELHKPFKEDVINQIHKLIDENNGILRL